MARRCVAGGRSWRSGREATEAASPDFDQDAAPGEAWTQPRTPGAIRTSRVSGDTKGAYRSNDPGSFEGREFLTDEEVAQRERSKRNRPRSGWPALEGAAVGRRSVGESPIRGNEYNSFWQDHGRPRQVSKQTSLIVDPRDGQIPYTPDATEGRGAIARRAYGVGPYESFLDPDTGERCLTDGVTAMMWQGPNGGHNRIVQSPGLRHDSPRGVPRPAHHPRGRPRAREHPPVVRRRRRPVGGRHARRRHDELHRPDQLRVGEDLHASVRDAAPGRALHAHRARTPSNTGSRWRIRRRSRDPGRR